MAPFVNELTNAVEPLYVSLLRGHQRVRTEVGEYFLHQIPYLPDFVLEGFVGSIRSDESASPLFLDHVEQLGSVCVLADRETRSNLPAESMSLTRLKRNAEAAFAVYEPRNVRGQIHREVPGPACYGLSFESIQGSHTLSRYGDSSGDESYPRYCPRRTCKRRREGFTDLSRSTDEIALVQGNVTYPTRNFATLGPFIIVTAQSMLLIGRPSRFRLALHVAMQIGPYHPRLATEVWHMVSEDSVRSAWPHGLSC
jgi:hypothetical protein